MGNKRDPRQVTITKEPTLITDLQTRSRILMKNDSGSTIGLHRRATSDADEEVPITFDDCYPYDDPVYDDTKSSDELWGILDEDDANDEITVWVWETEI
jgi:hypothetical protein